MSIGNRLFPIGSIACAILVFTAQAFCGGRAAAELSSDVNLSSPVDEGSSDIASSETTSEKETKSPEELLIFSDEELVTVATKRAVALGETPVNVAVITHDDIMRSPELSIPEILRRVAGVDVITVTAGESDISPRGFVATPVNGNRVEVLIDGRAVHLTPTGSTIFSTLPVSRYDIKRIEIIKGPMSSMHGDRAFLGTINIVTFDPDETRTVLAAGGGMFKSARGDFINAGEFTKNLWYKITANYDLEYSLDDVGGGRSKDLDMLGATGMIDWKPTEETKLRLTGGISNAKSVALQVAGISHWSLRDGFVMGDVSQDFGSLSKLAAKFWWRRNNISTQDLFASDFALGTFDSVNAEVRDTIDVNVTDWFRNVTTFGFEYRFLTTGSFSNAEDIHNFAGFIQNEFRFWEKLLITGGYRADYQKDFTGLNNSILGSIVWLAHPMYTLKANISHAFNTPTFFNYFLNVSNLGYSGVSITATGNRNLQSENILYFELMNEIRPKGWLTINADAFYYRMKDLIIPEMATSPSTSVSMTFANKGGVEAIGGELGVKARVVEGFNLYANWAYEHMHPILGNDYTVENLGNPYNKVNAGMSYVSDFGLFANVDFSWVQSHDAQAGAIFNFSSTPSVNIGNQYLLSARLGYQPVKDHLELAIVANNILNDNTPQIPQYAPLLNIRMAEKPAFRLLGTISYTF